MGDIFEMACAPPWSLERGQLVRVLEGALSVRIQTLRCGPPAEAIADLVVESVSRKRARSQTSKPNAAAGWTAGDISAALSLATGHRRRKLIERLLRWWGCDLAARGLWGELAAAMLGALQTRTCLEKALVVLSGYCLSRFFSGILGEDLGPSAQTEFIGSLRLVTPRELLPSWARLVPAWLAARNPWGDSVRGQVWLSEGGSFVDMTSSLSAVTRVWTHSTAKVSAAGPCIVPLDRLTAAFARLFVHSRDLADYAKYAYMLSQNRKVAMVDAFLAASSVPGVLPPLRTAEELAIVIDGLMARGFTFAQRGDVTSCNRNASSISHGIRFDLARGGHLGGTFGALLHCDGIASMDRLLTCPDTRLPVTSSGFSRGHYIAGLVYGMATAEPSAIVGPDKSAARKRAVGVLLPQLQFGVVAPDEAVIDCFGNGNNTVDFIRGFLTGGDKSKELVRLAFRDLINGLHVAAAAEYSFCVRGAQHSFFIRDICCIPNISAQLCQAYMHLEWANGICAPKNARRQPS